MATLPKIDGAAIFVNEMDPYAIHRAGRCCETLRQLIRAAAELKERCKRTMDEEIEDDEDDGGRNKCDTCAKEYRSCEAINIVFGSYVNRRAKGKEADRVVECAAYASTEEKKEKRDNWKARYVALEAALRELAETWRKERDFLATGERSDRMVASLYDECAIRLLAKIDAAKETT